MPSYKVLSNEDVGKIAVTTSKQFSLSLIDLGKGLIVAAIAGALTVIENALTTSPVIISWKAVGLAALTGAVAYLTKNFFTPSTTVVKTP